jgi:hypothetical protein
MPSPRITTTWWRTRTTPTTSSLLSWLLLALNSARDDNTFKDKSMIYCNICYQRSVV